MSDLPQFLTKTEPSSKEIAAATLAFSETIYHLTAGRREPSAREQMVAMRDALSAAYAVRGR